MASRPSMEEVGHAVAGVLPNHFSNQCLVYYHFVNLGVGRGGIIYF